MKKVGTTASGSIIVEMTAPEYEALQRLQSGGEASASRSSPVQDIAPRMSHSQRATYVSERLKKLSPKKRDGVVRSLDEMFQFNGGISAEEREKLIATLQKQKFFAIAQDGRVTYM